MSTGTKHDQGKAPWHLLPFDAVEQVVTVLQFGAEKYAERNWEGGIAFSRLFASICRHLVSWWRGSDADEESGLHPLAHAACDVLMMLALALRDTDLELDDRPRL